MPPYSFFFPCQGNFPLFYDYPVRVEVVVKDMIAHYNPVCSTGRTDIFGMAAVYSVSR
jgi:hypothetical protein